MRISTPEPREACHRPKIFAIKPAIWGAAESTSAVAASRLFARQPDHKTTQAIRQETQCGLLSTRQRTPSATLAMIPVEVADPSKAWTIICWNPTSVTEPEVGARQPSWSVVSHTMMVNVAAVDHGCEKVRPADNRLKIKVLTAGAFRIIGQIATITVPPIFINICRRLLSPEPNQDTAFCLTRPAR